MTRAIFSAKAVILIIAIGLFMSPHLYSQEEDMSHLFQGEKMAKRTISVGHDLFGGEFNLSFSYESTQGFSASIFGGPVSHRTLGLFYDFFDRDENYRYFPHSGLGYNLGVSLHLHTDDLISGFYCSFTPKLLQLGDNRAIDLIFSAGIRRPIYNELYIDIALGFGYRTYVIEDYIDGVERRHINQRITPLFAIGYGF